MGWTALTGGSPTVNYFHADALCGDLNLKAVRCESWGGFVFINPDLDAEPLLDFLDAMPAMLEAYAHRHDAIWSRTRSSRWTATGK